jgi:hypothetical protein
MSYNLWRSETDAYTLGFRVGTSRSEPCGEEMHASAKRDDVDLDRVDLLIAKLEHRLTQPSRASDDGEDRRRFGGHTPS